MTYLRTVLARTALQDLRYLFGQQAPFLGKRHSSSRLISSNSINKSSSVTLILFPFDPSFNFAIASTESAENLQINILSRICDPAFHFTFQLQLRSPDLSQGEQFQIVCTFQQHLFLVRAVLYPKFCELNKSLL